METELTKRIKALTHCLCANALVHKIAGLLQGRGQCGLRQYRPSGWRDVTDQTKVELLYNAMKKWCDGAVFV